MKVSHEKKLSRKAFYTYTGPCWKCGVRHHVDSKTACLFWQAQNQKAK